MLGLFFRRGVWLTGGGLLLGIAGALGVSRWIGSMMFGLSARDPATFVGAVGLVALVAVVAS